MGWNNIQHQWSLCQKASEGSFKIWHVTLLLNITLDQNCKWPCDSICTLPSAIHLIRISWITMISLHKILVTDLAIISFFLLNVLLLNSWLFQMHKAWGCKLRLWNRTRHFIYQKYKQSQFANLTWNSLVQLTLWKYQWWKWPCVCNYMSSL